MKRLVLVTTAHHGVFVGELLEQPAPDRVVLGNARMAIYWGTTRGVLQLAESGPTSSSKIGSVAPRIELNSVTMVADVSSAAAEKWTALP